MINLSPDEKVILVVKKHWFNLFFKFLGIFGVALLPLLIIILIKIFTDIKIPHLVSGIFWLIYAVWILFAWIGLFFFWTDYVLDIWIVTNKRIIDIEQKGLFVREISTLRLDQLQDTTTEIKGFLGTIFGFGQISLQTSAAEKEFIMIDAENVEEAKKIIIELHDQEIEGNQVFSLDQNSLKAIRGAVDNNPLT